MFDPDIAVTRFGCGRSAHVAPPRDRDAMLAALLGTDRIASRFRIEPFERYSARIVEERRLRRIIREDPDSPDAADLIEQLKSNSKSARRDSIGWLKSMFLRDIHTEDGLRERLVAFWADHFTAPGKTRMFRPARLPYIESAIRPHITGRFEDLLIAAILHPQMLLYLDQTYSVGPNSKFVKNGRPDRGLNENLARELLELHTLGVKGPYTQKDVRQLAELLAGLYWRPQEGVVMRAHAAEPGPEIVLGKLYGSRTPDLDTIKDALRDLARHPATARHIARKLAIHFVSDSPDPSLVAAIEAGFLDSDGDLAAVYAALLEHPAAWARGGANFKQPVQFMSSAMRALGVTKADLDQLRPKDITNAILLPLQLMGQPFERPIGPDGWAEDDGHWMTPQGMAARLQWALVAPAEFKRQLPDPRAFVDVALGPQKSAAVDFAAKAAESRREGVALILTSPAFQRH